jgi:hypothetical protein
MKRLIYLKIEDYNPENLKLKAPELENAKQKVIKQSIKEFKSHIKYFKIIEEFKDKPQVIIEFNDKDYDVVHDLLRSLDVVDIIDPHLPLTNNQLKVKAKEDAKAQAGQTEEQHLRSLKIKMEKYKK